MTKFILGYIVGCFATSFVLSYLNAREEELSLARLLSEVDVIHVNDLGWGAPVTKKESKFQA